MYRRHRGSSAEVRRDKNGSQAHGQTALSVVAQEDPSTFVKVAASIMPKETELTMREVVAKDLSDDALAAIAVGGD